MNGRGPESGHAVVSHGNLVAAGPQLAAQEGEQARLIVNDQNVTLMHD
jgi:hypothetical protein